MMTTPAPSRRQWFRFSIRTMLLLTTIIAGGLVWLPRCRCNGWPDRKEALSQPYVSALIGQNDAPLPIRLLGEKGVATMWTSATVEQNEQLARLFPEAEVTPEPYPYGQPASLVNEGFAYR